MKKWVKILLGAVLLVAIVILAAAYMLMPVKTKLYNVTKTDVTYKFKEKGIAVPESETKLFCQNSGKIEFVGVKEGDTVSAGSVIIKLDTSDLEYQLQQNASRIQSLEGQRTSTESSLRQQLSALEAQLDAVKQREREAYRGPLSSQIEQQEKDVEYAKNELDRAKSDYDRIYELYKSGSVSKKELDDAELNVKQAENVLTQKEKALEVTKQQAEPVEGTAEYFTTQKRLLQNQIDIIKYELEGARGSSHGQGKYYRGLIDEARAVGESLKNQIERSTVVAPFDGIIKELNVKQGEIITPATQIAVLMPKERLSIETYVLAKDAIYFSKEDKVSIIQERKEGDSVFSGRIIDIAPSAVAKVSALGLEEQRVKITVAPDDAISGIKAGYEFDVEFYPITEKNVIAVPSSALFSTDSGDAVWLVKNGKVVFAQVEKGITADEMTVIKSGLNEGDTVVYDSGQEGIKEGVRVKGE